MKGRESTCAKKRHSRGRHNTVRHGARRCNRNRHSASVEQKNERAETGKHAREGRTVGTIESTHEKHGGSTGRLHEVQARAYNQNAR